MVLKIIRNRTMLEAAEIISKNKLSSLKFADKISFGIHTFWINFHFDM